MAQAKRTPPVRQRRPLPPYWTGWSPAQIAAEMLRLQAKAEADGRCGCALDEAIAFELIVEMRRDLMAQVQS